MPLKIFLFEQCCHTYVLLLRDHKLPYLLSEYFQASGYLYKLDIKIIFHLSNIKYEAILFHQPQTFSLKDIKSYLIRKTHDQIHTT